MRYRTLPLALLATAAVLTGCARKQIDEQPIMRNGDRVASNDNIIAEARRASREDAFRLSSERDSLSAVALATCRASICDALARGEVAIGMNTTQVLAATRTTPDAWSIRQAAGITTMTPAKLDVPPKDVVGQIAVVQVSGDGVATYSYRERHGLRVVSSPQEASATARATMIAAGMVREGDDLAANGDFALALDRYDRASLLVPNDAEVDYKIAMSLEKLLRPVEALLRYQLFLQKLELQRIDAVGQANARLAEAIALAQQRIIVLERQSR
jgi:tetratricopeptide (TPR) repeat protein